MQREQASRSWQLRGRLLLFACLGGLLRAALPHVFGRACRAAGRSPCRILPNSPLPAHTQLLMLVFHGMQPNELVVKRLAMMGCTVLVLVHRWAGALLVLPLVPCNNNWRRN